jgi:uncharacterized protein YndB with AHSA1/START domain
MLILNKEVFVNAPLNEVFDFVKQPANLPKIWPGLVEMKDEKLLPNGGYSFRWKYKMSGIHFKGTGECVDIVPNLWFTSKTQGAIESTLTWTFRAIDDKTRVTLTICYSIPYILLRLLAERTISKMNEKEADLILDNLRKAFELTHI